MSSLTKMQRWSPRTSSGGFSPLTATSSSRVAGVGHVRRWIPRQTLVPATTGAQHSRLRRALERGASFLAFGGVLADVVCIRFVCVAAATQLFGATAIGINNW